MDKAHIIEHFRNQLAREVLGQGGRLPSFNPMNISPWLAMSLMQKAIRRGREELALRAAATLLNQAPDRLWRRLCVTAYEDIGVGDFDTVALVAAAMKGKRWRSDVGGDWAVASYLVARMCGSVKCRAADDLAYVCERHTRFEAARLAWAFEPLPRLLGQITSDAPLPERAIALWYACLLKTDCETARWARNQIPAKSQMGFFGHVLFRVEGGLVDRRLRWPIGDELRQMADVKVRVMARFPVR